MRTFAFALVLACGCSGSTGDGDHDHDTGSLTLEGQDLTDFLASSAPIKVDAGFRRVGFMWDAVGDGAIEIRTSLDGAQWSAWATPTVVRVEEIAHAGHVDAIAAGGAGSSDDDPVATWYQVRTTAGAAAPTFLVIQPLVDIPALVDPDEAIPDTADQDEAGAPTFSFVLNTPIGGLRVYSRADWGALAPQCSSGASSPNRFTIHHTVTPTNDSISPQARLRQIQSFHMFTNGWCDIGYNHLVSRDGRVWRGRGVATIGAHVANNNTGNVGVSFMGTYTSTTPTAGQMCSAAKLLRWVHERYPAVKLNRTDVKGHRQYGGTACPGNALYNKIDTIVNKAKNGC
jgi:hypothetical protein